VQEAGLNSENPTQTVKNKWNVAQNKGIDWAISILKGKCGDRPASLLVMSLGKALNGIASTYEWLDW